MTSIMMSTSSFSLPWKLRCNRPVKRERLVRLVWGMGSGSNSFSGIVPRDTPRPGLLIPSSPICNPQSQHQASFHTVWGQGKCGQRKKKLGSGVSKPISYSYSFSSSASCFHVGRSRQPFQLRRHSFALSQCNPQTLESTNNFFFPMEGGSGSGSEHGPK